MKHDPKLRKRAEELGLHGLVANWEEVANADWVELMITREEEERRNRSFERRVAHARLCAFKPMVDFDWNWPGHCDRKTVEAMLQLNFLQEGENAILTGDTGTGKTMIASNVGHLALCAGYTVRYTLVAPMLEDLANIAEESELRRKLNLLVRPALLIIDEIGYVSCSVRQADLLYHIVSVRKQRRRSIMAISSCPPSRWTATFPGAACVAALIDRLIHRAEILHIKAESYRLKEAKERRNKGE